MKKIYLLIAFLGFFILTSNVNAGVGTGPKITTAEYKNEKIAIEGTGSGQIQLVLFDLKNAPLYMTTVQANEGVFSITLPKIDGLVDGDYKIKVADYNGTNGDAKNVNVKIVPIPTHKVDNPQTGDNIMSSIIIGGLSILGIVGCVLYFKKKKVIVINY